jgi:hypothetical protein
VVVLVPVRLGLNGVNAEYVEVSWSCLIRL